MSLPSFLQFKTRLFFFPSLLIAVVLFSPHVGMSQKETSAGPVGAVDAYWGIQSLDSGLVAYAPEPSGHQAANAQAAFVPLQTSTPAADGSIWHVVSSGEALWDIAISYAVSIDEIRLLNGIPLDSTLINVSQRLLIRVTAPPTPVPTEPADSTSEQTGVDPFVLPMLTPTPTITLIPPPSNTPTPAGFGYVLESRLTRLQRFVLLAVTAIGVLILAGFVYSRVRGDIRTKYLK